jgi:hypothetical protein
VISLPKSLDMLAERIRVSYERTEHGRHEWIEGTLELAAALAEARNRFPSNSAFAACLHCVYKSIAAWISRRRCHKQKPACTHSAGGLFPCELVAKHFALTTDKINHHNSGHPHKIGRGWITTAATYIPGQSGGGKMTGCQDYAEAPCWSWSQPGALLVGEAGIRFKKGF